MGRSSRLWLLAAVLLFAGAALDAAALALFWRPCACSMLEGSVLRGYQYSEKSFDAAIQARVFSDECLLAMDAGVLFPLPVPGEDWTLMGGLGAAGAVLLATSWLVLLPALPAPRVVKLVASLPGILQLFVVLDASLRSSGPPTSDSESFLLPALVEVAVLVTLIALTAAGVQGPVLARATIVLLAATALGVLHQATDYMVMLGLSDANWDVPPGSGYLTVGFCVNAAVATVLLWWLDRRRASSHPALRTSVAPHAA